MKVFLKFSFEFMAMGRNSIKLLFVSVLLLFPLAKADNSVSSEVEFYIFKSGKPVSGVAVRVRGDVNCTSDSRGFCRLKVPHGDYWLSDSADRSLELGTSSVPDAPVITVSSRGVANVYVDWEVDTVGSLPPAQDTSQGNSENQSEIEEAKAPVNGVGGVKSRYRVDLPLGSENSLTDEGNAADGIGSVKLRIQVHSFTTGQPISGVQVFVKGLDAGARTDGNGSTVLELAPGLYDLAFVHSDYTSLTLRNVAAQKSEDRAGDKNLVAGRSAQSESVVEAALSPAAISLEEMVVSAPHIRGSEAGFNEIRRESLEVNDVIGAEQMSKNGDSSAASALRRVTGLTLLEGKYIYVRGLGERYSSVTLNGSYLPSPEPMRKVVPLDIFPSSILEGVVVQKTFTPDMPGEFGGGTLRLRTKRSFDEDRIKLSYGQGYGLDSGTRLIGPQGGRDWTGYDDGTRALPESIRKADRGKIVDGGVYSDAELEAFGESFKNSYSLSKNRLDPIDWKDPGASRILIGDSRNVSAEMRQSGELGLFKWGSSLSGLYGNGYDDGTRSLKRYNADSGRLTSIDKDLSYTFSKRKIDAGGLGHLRLGIGDHHTIEAISLLTRKTTDTAQVKEGMTGSGDDVIRSTTTEWNERELFFNQFIGSHEFLKIFEIEWRYSQSDARNYIPDSRSYRYEQRGTDYLISNRADGNSRTFSSLVDLAEDWGTDISLTMANWKPFVFRYMGGLSSFYKKRNYEARRFFFRSPDFLDASLRIRKPEEIFTPENISQGGFNLVETSRNTDTYLGRQIIDAVYSQGELSFGDSVALVSGVRMEESRQDVLTYSLHDSGLTPDTAELSDKSILPSSNLTLRIGQNMQLRGAYSETVSRPDLRELSTGSYFDDRLDIEVEGYPDLEISSVRNIDARLEIYSGKVNRFSIGVFRKDIKRPIERVLLNVAGSDTKISYRNSRFARNEGVEVELAMGKGPVVLSGNIAFIDSKVSLDLSEISSQASLTSAERSMQGVSPYILNAGIQFDPQGAGYRANLIFNQIGPRITELGTNGVPDVFETEKWTLDLVGSYDATDSIEMGLKLSDIVPQGTKTTQDGKTILEEPGSTSLSWSVSATF